MLQASCLDWSSVEIVEFLQHYSLPQESLQKILKLNITGRVFHQQMVKILLDTGYDDEMMISMIELDWKEIVTQGYSPSYIDRRLSNTLYTLPSPVMIPSSSSMDEVSLNSTPTASSIIPVSASPPSSLKKSHHGKGSHHSNKHVSFDQELHYQKLELYPDDFHMMTAEQEQEVEIDKEKSSKAKAASASLSSTTAADSKQHGHGHHNSHHHSHSHHHDTKEKLAAASKSIPVATTGSSSQQQLQQQRAESKEIPTEAKTNSEKKQSQTQPLQPSSSTVIDEKEKDRSHRKKKKRVEKKDSDNKDNNNKPDDNSTADENTNTIPSIISNNSSRSTDNSSRIDQQQQRQSSSTAAAPSSIAVVPASTTLPPDATATVTAATLLITQKPSPQQIQPQLQQHQTLEEKLASLLQIKQSQQHQQGNHHHHHSYKQTKEGGEEVEGQQLSSLQLEEEITAAIHAYMTQDKIIHLRLSPSQDSQPQQQQQLVIEETAATTAVAAVATASPRKEEIACQTDDHDDLFPLSPPSQLQQQQHMIADDKKEEEKEVSRRSSNSNLDDEQQSAHQQLQLQPQPDQQLVSAADPASRLQTAEAEEMVAFYQTQIQQLHAQNLFLQSELSLQEVDVSSEVNKLQVLLAKKQADYEEVTVKLASLQHQQAEPGQESVEPIAQEAAQLQPAQQVRRRNDDKQKQEEVIRQQSSQQDNVKTATGKDQEDEGDEGDEEDYELLYSEEKEEIKVAKENSPSDEQGQKEKTIQVLQTTLAEMTSAYQGLLDSINYYSQQSSMRQPDQLEPEHTEQMDNNSEVNSQGMHWFTPSPQPSSATKTRRLASSNTTATSPANISSSPATGIISITPPQRTVARGSVSPTTPAPKPALPIATPPPTTTAPTTSLQHQHHSHHQKQRKLKHYEQPRSSSSPSSTRPATPATPAATSPPPQHQPPHHHHLQYQQGEEKRWQELTRIYDPITLIKHEHYQHQLQGLQQHQPPPVQQQPAQQQPAQQQQGQQQQGQQQQGHQQQGQQQYQQLSSEPDDYYPADFDDYDHEPANHQQQQLNMQQPLPSAFAQQQQEQVQQARLPELTTIPSRPATSRLTSFIQTLSRKYYTNNNITVSNAPETPPPPPSVNQPLSSDQLKMDATSNKKKREKKSYSSRKKLIDQQTSNNDNADDLLLLDLDEQPATVEGKKFELLQDYDLQLLHTKAQQRKRGEEDKAARIPGHLLPKMYITYVRPRSAAAGATSTDSVAYQGTFPKDLTKLFFDGQEEQLAATAAAATAAVAHSSSWRPMSAIKQQQQQLQHRPKTADGSKGSGVGGTSRPGRRLVSQPAAAAAFNSPFSY